VDGGRQHAQVRRLHGPHVALDLGDAVAHHRVFDGGAPAAQRRPRARQQALELGGHELRIADQVALVLQGGARHRPALAALADEVLRRRAHVVEEHLVELEASGDLLERTHLDARRLHVDEQVGDAGVLAGVGLGAEQAEHEVGLAGVAGPDLLAVDHPVRAVEPGRGWSEARSLPEPGSL
jgi:hypothetical protein